MMQNKKKTKFTHISKIIPTILPAPKKNALEKISKAWEKAVDDLIFQNAKPYFFKKGTLTLKVVDSNFMHNLQFFKKEIKKKLITYFQKKIKFQI